MSNPNIRFSPKINPEFVIELRGKVKDYFEQNKLSQYGNSSIVVKSVLMTSLYLVPFILMWTGVIQSVPAFLLAWIIMGLGMSGVGMVLMHDANHRSLSKNQKVNDALSASLYFLGGFPATWRYQHNTLHHGFTNIDGQDEDIDPVVILRFSPHKPLRKIHRFQHYYAWFFYGLMTVSFATTKDFKQHFRYKKSGVYRSNKITYTQMFTKLLVSKALYYIIFLILPMLFFPISWYWTLLFFFIQHFVSGFVLSTIFQTAHVMPTSEFPVPDENGNIENNWAVHQLLTTTDYAPRSRVFSWLIGGLNYQVEHHLFPNISHVHYKKISRLVMETANKYNLPYHVQPNFFAALRNHAKMLKSLGRNESPVITA